MRARAARRTSLGDAAGGRGDDPHACSGSRQRSLISDADWLGTRVGFELSRSGTSTQVRFHHTSWPEANEHYRISCYCWAMYLRIMKRYLEYGETVPYEQRLEV